MKTIDHRIIMFLTALWVLSGRMFAPPAEADLPGTPDLREKYRLEIRVLTGGNPAARGRDREWAQLFQRAGYQVTISTDNGGYATGIRSRTVGRRSVVELIGRINRGELQLGSKRYRPGDVKPLQEFLDDLQTHGADGPIRQRPTWGLSIPQYTEVLQLLAVKVDSEIPLSSPAESVTAMRLSREFRVTWSPEAKKVALSPPDSGGTMDLRGLSSGTGLAIVLAQSGLGFRVIPHPRSGFLLEIDAGGESDNLWPVGWKNKQPVTVVVPAMYRHVEVDLDDEQVTDVLDLIGDRVELPWFSCRERLAADHIDLDRVRFSTPPAKMMPARLLRAIASDSRMSIEPRTDEAGRVFLWCTTVKEQAAWKRRFAHVIPGAETTQPSPR